MSNSEEDWALVMEEDGAHNYDTHPLQYPAPGSDDNQLELGGGHQESEDEPEGDGTTQSHGSGNVSPDPR